MSTTGGDRLLEILDKVDGRLATLNDRLGQLAIDSEVARIERGRLSLAVDDHETRIRANESQSAIAAVERITADHETRIRANERAVYKWAGAIAVTGFLVALAVKAFT